MQRMVAVVGTTQLYQNRMYGLAGPICKLGVFTVKHSRGRLVTRKPERRRPTLESELGRENLGMKLLGVPEKSCQISNIQNR